MNRRHSRSIVIFIVVASLGVFAMAYPQEDSMSEFEQILDRGRIASIDEPEFVSAAAAGIADDAWVLGVVVDGEARAYSLSLLNSHEIVNDEVAGQPIAAVW